MDVLAEEIITQLVTSIRFLTEYVKCLGKYGVTLIRVDGSTLESYRKDTALDIADVFCSALSAYTAS